MTHAPNGRPRCRKAATHVLALGFLIVLSAMAVALVSGTMLNLRAGDNYRRATGAQLAAESGMAFVLNQLAAVRLTLDTTEETMATNLAGALGEELDGTANLNGQPVTLSGTQVSIPEIALPDGSFSCTLTPNGADRCTLVVLGTAEDLTRTVAIDLQLVARHSDVFDYGIASFGPVTVAGNARIVGVNDPSEASILAVPGGAGPALTLGGNSVVEGQATLAGDGSLAVSGNPSLGGTTDPALMQQQIETLSTPPEVPAIQTDAMTALATNIVDSGTDTSSPGLTFSNIRIVAGTDPTFSSDVVLNGIVYVEAPNVVNFADRTTINGMVITEDSSEPIESCQLHFSGHVEAYGVEALPDTPEFAEVKQYTGTFLLAPGFAATFSGQFSAISGTIAADQLTFTGQSEGIIQGAVIGLSDRPTTLDGTVEIRVDRVNSYPNPAGFVKSFALEAEAASYEERIGG